MIVQLSAYDIWYDVLYDSLNILCVGLEAGWFIYPVSDRYRIVIAGMSSICHLYCVVQDSSLFAMCIVQVSYL